MGGADLFDQNITTYLLNISKHGNDNENKMRKFPLKKNIKFI